MVKVNWFNFFGIIFTIFILIDYLIIEAFDLVGAYFVAIIIVLLANLIKEERE